MAVPVVPTDGTWLTPEYEFIRILGRGGTGWVALARHLPLDRLVAVKTMHGGSLNPSATARVRREGRILAGLRHPGIVTVYQMLSVPRSLSLVMEYLPGGDLGQALERDQLTGSELVAVLVQVAGALGAAAEAGIVHRDVKPGNVLLDGRGRAVLADFGLARLQGAAGEYRTIAGTVTGTPLYMAPEQIDDPDVETPAIDAYAFGTLAYRLLTGEYPYAAVTLPDIIEAHRSAPARTPGLIRESLPPDACRALLGALDKNPATRTRPQELARVLSLTHNKVWDDLLGRKPLMTTGTAVVQSPPATGTSPGPPPLFTETSSSAATGTQGDPRSLVAPEPVGSEPAVRPIGVQNQAQINTFQYPEREEWIVPTVYVVPSHRHRRWIPPVAGIVVGLLLGIVLFLILVNL